MDFKISGRVVRVSRQDVELAILGLSPEPLRTHVVEVDGVWFPVKQALAATTNLDVLDFTTNQARSVLRRLGFNVKRLDG